MILTEELTVWVTYGRQQESLIVISQQDDSFPAAPSLIIDTLWKGGNLTVTTLCIKREI